MHAEKRQWIPSHGSAGISNLVLGHCSKGLDEQGSNLMHGGSLNFINHVRMGDTMLSVHKVIRKLLFLARGLDPLLGRSFTASSGAS